MGQTHAKSSNKLELVVEVNQQICDTFRRMISGQTQLDLDKIGVAVIETCFKLMLQEDPKLCVPDFLFPADHVTLKTNVIQDKRGMAWKDVLAVKNGIHTIMVLHFRVPDTIDYSFDLPFKWHVIHAGDDGRSFNLTSDHSTTILYRHPNK
jgi:hypothetical protein